MAEQSSVEGRQAYATAMREGHAHAWAARWHDAAGAYRRALAALPDDASARASLASALAHGGLPAEALQMFEGLAAERPEDSAVALRVAELRQRVGRMDEADEAYLHVAGLYQQAGQPEKAQAIWRRLMETSGHRADSMRRLADAASAAGSAEVADRAHLLAAAAADTVVAQARADEAERDAVEPGDHIGELAGALRARGLVKPLLHTVRLHPHDRPSYAAEDDALAGLAREPYDLTSARQLGLALRTRGADRAAEFLSDVADVAELSGELGLAIDVLRDGLPLAEDPVPLHRRIVRLALVGDAVEVAADGHLAIARYLLGRGDRVGVATEVRRARAVAPLIPRIQAEAAALLRQVGETADADDADRRAFQLAPREPLYAIAYAAVAARRGSVDEAAIAVESVPPQLEGQARETARATIAAQLKGSMPLLLWVRGRLAEAAGEPTWESDLATAATASAPVGPRAATYLAQRRFERGDARGSLDLLIPWLEGRRDGLDPADEAWTAVAGLALSAADALGDEATAIASLRALAAGSPDDQTTPALLAERLAASGDPAAAAAELGSLAERRQTSGDVDAAAALLDGALALAPDDPGLLRRSAELALARGDREAARERFVAAASASNGEAAVAVLLAAAELAPWGQRVELLRRAVATDNQNVEPRRRLVAALMASGQASQAAAASAELAELLHASGDRAGALESLEQARRLDPWNTGLVALHEALKAEATTGE